MLTSLAAKRVLSPLANGRASTSATSSLITGLLGYWKMDEASGNRSDSGTNGITISPTSPLGSAAGIIGSSADVPLTAGCYLSAADNPAFDTITTKAAWSWWYRLNVNPGSFRVFMNRWNHTVSSEWLITCWPTGDMFVFIASAPGDGGSNYKTFPATFDADAGAWHHMVINYDGTLAEANRLSVWKDGAPLAASGGAGTIGASILAGTPAFNVGAEPTLGWQANARIDEAGIWSRDLTVTEVATLYNSGAGLTYPF